MTSRNVAARSPTTNPTEQLHPSSAGRVVQQQRRHMVRRVTRCMTSSLFYTDSAVAS